MPPTISSALSVARCLLQLAASGDAPEHLSQLRLHKLLYYVQGWSLALRGGPLFADRIEAWKYGPVVASLYPRFKPFGHGGIPPEAVDEPDELSEEDRAFVRSVWDAYRQHSAVGLRNLTHAEAPWREARAGLLADAPSNRELTHAALGSFFHGVMNDNRVPGLSVERVRRAAEQFDRGEGHSHEEVFARLRGRK